MFPYFLLFLRFLLFLLSFLRFYFLCTFSHFLLLISYAHSPSLLPSSYSLTFSSFLPCFLIFCSPLSLISISKVSTIRGFCALFGVFRPLLLLSVLYFPSSLFPSCDTSSPSHHVLGSTGSDQKLDIRFTSLPHFPSPNWHAGSLSRSSVGYFTIPLSLTFFPYVTLFVYILQEFMKGTWIWCLLSQFRVWLPPRMWRRQWCGLCFWRLGFFIVCFLLPLGLKWNFRCILSCCFHFAWAFYFSCSCLTGPFWILY